MKEIAVCYPAELRKLPEKPIDSDYYDLDLIIPKSSLPYFEKLIFDVCNGSNIAFYVKRIDKEYVVTFRVILINRWTVSLRRCK